METTTNAKNTIIVLDRANTWLQNSISHHSLHRLALSIKALEEKPQSADDSSENHSSNNSNNNRNRNNNGGNRRRNNRNSAETSTANAPEESTGFSLGDLIGDSLKKDMEDNENN